VKVTCALDHNFTAHRKTEIQSSRRVFGVRCHANSNVTGRLGDPLIAPGCW